MCKHFKHSWIIILALFCLIVSCGDSGTGDDEENATSASETIGPEGGDVIITNKINLRIPNGALSDSVDFTIERNDSPTPIGGTMAFVSPVYSVEPTGTNFAASASIALFYDSSELFGHDSTDIVLYTNDGTGWTALTTIIDNAEPAAWSMIDHLCDFALAVDTEGSASASGVYALMVAGRNIVYAGGTYSRMDVLTVKFDSSYAPCDIIDPQQAGGVSCNGNDLEWFSETSSYLYQNVEDLDFIELGQKMKFTIAGNSRVPSFADSINFPSEEVLITSPATGAIVSHSGFMVNWDGPETGNVRIVLVSTMADSVISIETTNDGSHEITDSDLEGKANGMYTLLLIYEITDNIDAVGIDSRSIIAARIFNSVIINLGE